MSLKLISSFSQRLNEAMQIRLISQIELSRKTNLSKALISKYCLGKCKAGNDRLLLLSRALNVSPVWLMGFDVPMVDSMSTSTHITKLESINSKLMNLSESQLNIIEMMIDQMIN